MHDFLFTFHINYVCPHIVPFMIYRVDICPHILIYVKVEHFYYPILNFISL